MSEIIKEEIAVKFCATFMFWVLLFEVFTNA
jgi:hypothetical protein